MQVRFCASVVRAVVLTFTLIASVSAIAQTTGRIIGQVTDSTGAVLPGVRITVVNEQTGASRTAETSRGGDFVIPEIPVGTYSVEIEGKGFKKSIRRNVRLQLNQVVTVNQVLELGEAQQVVEVTSEAPLVDTTSTQIGAVIDSHSVTELPLNARDTYQFLQLQPGVQSQLGGSGDLFYGSDRAGAVSVNGGRGRANNFSVNGGDANDQFANLPTVQPSPDSIEEFRVLTNTFDAEYGRNSGAVVNVVTKSGTNQYHGNLYEFFRNKVLNAKGYFDTVKPDFQQNQYGATFGGPIKKDRTFFFVSYEGRRIKQGKSSDNVYVPTAQERPTAQQPYSDFNDSGSQFGGNLTSDFAAQVLNSRPGCSTAMGGPIAMPSSQGGSIAWSSIFPNAKIPVQCMDPTAVDLMRFMPATNAVDSAGVPYWQGVPNGRDHLEQGTIRLDHRISERQNLSFYYYITDDDLLQPFAFFQQAGANVPGFGSAVGQRFQQYNLSHTWTLTNAIVNEARLAYNREAQRKFQTPQNTGSVTNSCTSAAAQYCFTGTSESSVINDAATGAGSFIGINPNLGANREGVPFIQIGGGTVIGNNFEGQLPQVGNTFQWSDNLSWVKGNHTMKFGTDVRRQRFDQTYYYNVNGWYTVTGSGPNSIAPSASTDVASLYPDYLLGLIDSYSQGSAQKEEVRSTSLYLFAQDSWKMSKSVTLNYGLRWELNTPLTDILGHVQTFRPGQNSTQYPCTISPANIPYFQSYGIAQPDCNNTGTLPTGIVFPGDKGVPAGMTTTDYKAWAPRIGLSWSPSAEKGLLGKLLGSAGRTSIHTGYGIFYNPIEQLVLAQFGAEPPFGGSNFITNSFFNTPFIDQTGATYPNPFVQGILSPKPGTPQDWSNFRSLLLYGEFQPHLKTQYSEQYNFTIERQLRDDLLLQIGYVGSQGHHLLASHDLNPGTPQTCLDIMAIANANPNNVQTALSGGNATTCGPLGSDSAYYIMPGTVLPVDLHFPSYAAANGAPAVLPAGSSVGPNGISIVGTRPYSSPNCNPLSGSGCPVDGIPIFANVFAQDTIANSSYNSMQLMVEKRYKHGLQLQGAYTWSKSFDWASSFEETLNPFNFRASRALSLFDARHRFVLSYYWDIPTGKHVGALGKLVNGWALSGISSFQSGFPIRMQTQNDNELITSIDFAGTTAPSLNGPLVFLNPKKNGNYWFETTNPVTQAPIFGDPTLGQFGNLKRTLCCGPGTNNTDLAIHKKTNISETKYIQFRAELFNVFNHTQFFNPDGNFSDGTDFGRIKRARDPRLIQFGLKFYY
jgi:hypothetical protein